MHGVVIKRSVYEDHPWLAKSLYKAFETSKNLTLKSLHLTSALHVMLPWLVKYVEETETIMGHDWWPYGIESDQETMRLFASIPLNRGCRLEG